jgi:hypothetical protein
LAHAESSSDWNAFHTTDAQRRHWAAADADDVRGRYPSLRKQSPPDPVLDITIHEVLRRILLTADGAVTTYTSVQIVKGTVDQSDGMQRLLADVKPYNHDGRIAESREPASTLADVVDVLSVRYARAKTDWTRLVVIGESQAILDSIRYAPNRSRIRWTPEWRAAIAQDARSCRVLANVYGVSFGTVRSIKKDAGTLAKRGRPRNDQQLAAA